MVLSFVTICHQPPPSRISEIYARRVKRVLIFHARSLTPVLLSFFDPTQHPCGTGEYAEPEEPDDLDFSTCAKSFDVIMGNIDYTIAVGHVVPCPTDVCVSKCAGSIDEATNGTFQCFNASTLMSATEVPCEQQRLGYGMPRKPLHVRHGCLHGGSRYGRLARLPLPYCPLSSVGKHENMNSCCSKG